jgi:hypothetical protein
VRGCEPQALELAVWCQLIPIHLGWVIARAAIPGFLGWNVAAMAIPEWLDSVQCANANLGHWGSQDGYYIHRR